MPVTTKNFGSLMATIKVERPAARRCPGRVPAKLIVLGTDGAGKSTVIAALVKDLERSGLAAQQLANTAGRRWLNRRSRELGLSLSPLLQDFIESVIRGANVLLNSLKADRFCGISVMDRHIYCQLVLRQLRGQFSGFILPWLARRSTKNALIVVLDVPPELAHYRVHTREDDFETLDYLRASRGEYLNLAKANGWPVIDSSRPIAQVVAQLRALLAQPEVEVDSCP